MAINFFNSLAVGTNVLYVDTLNDRVGIGTSTPDTGTNLHVLTGTGSGQIKLTSQANTQFQFYGNGNQDINYGSPPNFPLPGGDAVGQIRYSHGSNYMAFKVNNSERMRIDSGGNVGIGTTSPNTALEVDGAISTTTSDYVQGSTGSRLLLETSGSGNTHSYIQAQNAGGTSSNEDLALQLYGGSVGIGTDNPSNKLDVAGGDNSGIRIASQDSGNTWKNIEILSYVTESQAASFVSGSNIYTTSPSGATTWPFTEYAALVIEGRDNQQGGIALRTGTGSGQATRIAIREAGNVGIGTTSPSEKLVVSGNTSITNNLYVGFSNTLKSCTYPAQYGLAVGSSNSLGGFANGIIGRSNSIDCTIEPWLALGGNFTAGINNDISGGYSHANAVFGQLNELGTSSINVSNTLIGGSEHEVTSSNALVFGSQCRAFSARYSLTGGFDSNNFGQFGSIAIGAGATASTGNNQYAFGTGVTTPTSVTFAYGPDQFVVGKFNVYSTGGRVHRFAVGNGSNDFSRSNALNVDSLGRTGLGIVNPSYQLQLSLNSAAKPTSSSWTVVSDERVKTNIQDYTTGLTEILQINPKTFDYNGKAGFEETTGNIGIIAQDVQGIMPETINTYEAKLNEDDAEETELFNFDSHPIQFALINAVKELNAKVEALEARIQTLENN